MASFEPIISEEMMDKLVAEVYEYVKKGTLSELKVMGVARELIEKRDDDGVLIFYDVRVEGKDKPVGLDSMISRIRIIIQNWKKYLGQFMVPLLIEATYKHALKAKDSPASFKTVAELVMPKESADDDTKPTLPSGLAAVLQNNPVGTKIYIGQDCVAQGIGDKGHECADTVHIVADGQQQDTPVEVVPLGNDKPVHGVHEGGDTPQRSAIPDTEVPPENPVDNNGWDDMDIAE